MNGRLTKKLLAFIMMLTLIVPNLYVSAIAAPPKTPVFSQQGGYYEEQFDLSISSTDGATIRYTTDGSTPTASSPICSAPITIKEQNSAPLASALGYGNRYYMKATVIRAKAFATDGTSSSTVTHTYFVAPDMKTRFTMPIYAVTIEPSDFIGPQGMYSNPYTDLNPECLVEYYTPEGKLGFKQVSLVKITGHASLGAPKKSLRFNFGKGEGNLGSLKYDLIPSTYQNYNSDKRVVEHSKISARISDWTESTIRENLTAKLARPLRNDTMENAQHAVFINGEFWGVYAIREQVDNNFFAMHYDGIKKGQIVSLAFDHTTANPGYDPSEPLYRVSYDEGPSGGEATYYKSFMDMYNIMAKSDMTNPANFEELKKYADVDNLIDCFMVYYFTNNDDWPGNNVKIWRTVDADPKVYGKDQKWRFIIHDFDIAYANPNIDDMVQLTTDRGIFEARKPPWAAAIFRNLFKNEEFRNLIAARYSSYIGTAFKPEVTLSYLDALVAEVEPDITKDFFRWGVQGGSLANISTWKNGQIAGLRNFLNNRSLAALGHIRNYYNNNFRLGLPSAYTQVNFSIDSEYGYFDVSGAQIRPNLFGNEMASNWGSQYIQGLPINIKAVSLTDREFSHFEKIIDGVTEKIYADSFTLTPGSASAINIKAVYAEDVVDPPSGELLFSAKAEGNSIIATLENGTDAAVSASLILGVYDSTGKMIASELASVNVAASASADYTFGVDASKYPGCTFKVFAWDGNYIPLFKAIVVDVK